MPGGGQLARSGQGERAAALTRLDLGHQSNAHHATPAITHVVTGFDEDLAEPFNDLIQQLRIAVQRRSDLQDAVPAVVGARDQPGFAQLAWEEPAQQVVALVLVEAPVVLVA